MKVDSLKLLVSNASIGIDNFNKSTVGLNGYGFLYKKIRRTSVHSEEQFFIRRESGKVCGAGAHFGDFESFMTLDEIEFNKLSDIGGLLRDIKHDLLLAGSLKTLLPDIVFGGHEQLFEAWMFVKTPDDKFFPATFYYGASGTSIGGWHPENYDIFPVEFRKLINCSPFDLDKDSLTGLIEAHMFALQKVPVSDFCGIYRHDLGNALMCVHDGVAFTMELGYDYEYGEDEVKIVLDYLGYDFERDKFKFREMVKKARRNFKT